MTIDDIRRRVQTIKNAVGDDEVQHTLEDALHRQVLRAIADEAPGPWNLMASEALTTLDIDFARWCG